MLLACEQAHLRVARERRRAKRSGVKESGEEVPITSSPRGRVRLHSNVSLDVVSTSHNPKKRWVWHSREGIHVLIMAVNKECFAMNFKPSRCMNMNQSGDTPRNTHIWWFATSANWVTICLTALLGWSLYHDLHHYVSLDAPTYLRINY